MSNPLPLYQFMEAARDCSKSALESNAVALSRCAELDAFIDRTASSRLKPPMAALLRINARGMICASINTALIGYRAALFPTLRASLEAVCYAQEIERRPELSDAWVNRHRSDEDRKRSRKAFGDAVSNTCKRFGRLMPDNAGLVRQIYDAMIDDGAHPNVRSILPSVRMKETETHHEFSIGLVIPERVEIALFCCYEIGLFTSWLMGDLENLDEDFWIEASRLNEVKNDWENELLPGRS